MEVLIDLIENWLAVTPTISWAQRLSLLFTALFAVGLGAVALFGLVMLAWGYIRWGTTRDPRQAKEHLEEAKEGAKRLISPFLWVALVTLVAAILSLFTGAFDAILAPEPTSQLLRQLL